MRPAFGIFFFCVSLNFEGNCAYHNNGSVSSPRHYYELKIIQINNWSSKPCYTLEQWEVEILTTCISKLIVKTNNISESVYLVIQVDVSHSPRKFRQEERVPFRGLSIFDLSRLVLCGAVVYSF